MSLPTGGLHQLRQASSACSSEQPQHFRALAPGARTRLRLRCFGGLAGVFLGLGPLPDFRALGASFLAMACFFAEAFTGAMCAPCSPAVAGVVVFALVIWVVVLFCASCAARFIPQVAPKVERNLRTCGIAMCSPDPSFLEMLLEKLALAIPARFTRDLAQARFADEAGVTCGEKQEVFLDRRSQMQ